MLIANSKYSAGSWNSLVGGSSGEYQIVARDDVGPEVAANSSQNTLLDSILSPRIPYFRKCCLTEF